MAAGGGLPIKKATKSLLQATSYDFESYQDKMQKNKVMPNLRYQNIHISISVSICDIVQAHIHAPWQCRPERADPVFIAELEQRGG